MSYQTVVRKSEREFRSGTLGEWMTRAQAAKVLKMSPQAVSQLMRKGKVGYCIVGRRKFPNCLSVQAYGFLRGAEIVTRDDNEGK